MPADAAAEAGFSDQSHMTRAFVRQLGVTPARYRAAVA
jgi:AraC-like DNA-binding protein